MITPAAAGAELTGAEPTGAEPTGAVLVTLPDSGWLDAVQPLPPGVRARVWDVDSPPAQALGQDAGSVRAVVLPYLQRASAIRSLDQLPALSLVQSLSAGVDNLVGKLPPGVPLANAGGVHDASTAELAVGLVLASLRGVDDAVRDQEQGRWRPVWRPSLADRRVLLLGAGRVGAAIADRLAPFEVDLVRVASRARTDERGVVHGVEDLPDLLPEAEVVVVALPLSDATRGLVDARFLAALPDEALVVNVGRGPLVDTGALLAELQQRRLRAALDVVDPEPLPADHPLWAAPGLILTPHVGGTTSAMRPRAVALLRRQLERLGAGEEPVNLIS